MKADLIHICVLSGELKMKKEKKTPLRSRKFEGIWQDSCDAIFVCLFVWSDLERGSLFFSVHFFYVNISIWKRG